MKKRMIQNGLLAVGCLLAAIVLSGCTTPLVASVGRGNEGEVQRMLDAGVDINEKNYWNPWSPLFAAVYAGNTEMVRLLLKNGAEIGGVDPHGRTILELANKRGSPEMVQLIEAEPHKREMERARAVGERMVKSLKGKSLEQLLQKYPLENETFVNSLIDALVEAKVTQLPTFIVTASYDEKTAMQVAIEQRLLQSAVELQQCNNEAQGYAEQGDTLKATECRNRAMAIISYQTVLKAIKAELEKE
jgi:hypothetical protein